MILADCLHIKLAKAWFSDAEFIRISSAPSLAHRMAHCLAVRGLMIIPIQPRTGCTKYPGVWQALKEFLKTLLSPLDSRKNDNSECGITFQIPPIIGHYLVIIKVNVGKGCESNFFKKNEHSLKIMCSLFVRKFCMEGTK